MKRALCVLLICTLTAFFLSGCGKEKTESKQKSEVSDSQQENNASDSQQKTAEELQAIEIREITERDWEEKAKITLGDSVQIEGSGAEVKKNIISISEGGSYEITGTLADGMVYIETEDAVKLVLNQASITSTTGPAIFAYNSEEVWIETAEGTENTFVDAAEYAAVFEETATTEEATTAEDTTATDTTEEDEDAGKGTIFSNDDLIFTGKGTLNVKGNYKHGICSDDSVYFQSGNYILEAVKDGVQANDDLVVNAGNIVVTDCEEGLESKASMFINGGTVEITGNDDGLNAATLLQINDGTVYANVSIGDGLDSNGNLEINGGTVVALGGSVPEGGADCDNSAFIIRGGTLIATGGVNSSPSENESTQASVLLGAANIGDVLGILDAEGNTVFTFEVSKAYSNMLLSGSFFTEGSSYTVYTGGTVTGTENSYGYYANAEYAGGTESTSFTVEGMVVSAGGTAGMQGGMGGGMQGGGRGQENGQFPQRGERPEGMRPPEGMEIPENGEGLELPEGAQIPEFTNPMENGETTQGDNTL